MGPEGKKEYIEAIRRRYRESGRKRKTLILDELCAVYGYGRKYAIRVLSRRCKRPKLKRGPDVIYGEEVFEVVKELWLASDRMCSKRLKAAIPLWLPYYEREYAPLSPEIREKVLFLSPATIDRLLRTTRMKGHLKGLCGTKPGTLLRNQIPILTDHWDITSPGFLEADTVAHCGNSMAGNFVWSLTFTDIYSGWTENRATWNRGSHGVIEQIEDVESRLVFPLLGFDCDNGAEFLNHHLLRYFAERSNPVKFTRGRPYCSNDNAHVEQKNWTHVRQLLGYDRFENPEMVGAINNLYTQDWSLFQNFFCPTFKLKSKKRVNSKYRRQYDLPTTPYQRLMESSHVSPEGKARLQKTFQELDPFQLKSEIERKLRIIFNLHRKGQS